jgi:hypothetical protein
VQDQIFRNADDSRFCLRVDGSKQAYLHQGSLTRRAFIVIDLLSTQADNLI